MADGPANSEPAASQADEGQTAPYLPPEVHCIIAQYVHSVDLPNYRLVSKQLAEIGAPELFSAITFHCSSASTSRVKSIKACKHLNKHVNTLIWDSNSWKIPDVLDFPEWQRYFKTRQRMPLSPSTAVGNRLPTAKLKSLTRDRRAWERYLDRIEDEKTAKTKQNLADILSGFANLHKLHVLNGGLIPAQRGAKKSSDFVQPLQPPTEVYRGQGLYHLSSRPNNSHRPGRHAFASIRSFRSMDWSLTKLRLDAICWSVFLLPGGSFLSLQGVTSLHLVITLRFDNRQQDDSTHDDDINTSVRPHLRRSQNTLRRRHLTGFLMELPKLRSLKLAFDEPFHEECLLAMKPTMTTIHHIFSEDHTWPDLHKLSLRNIGTKPDALLSLMRRHSGTLKTLGLHDINFEESKPSIEYEMQPAQLFEEMQEFLCLERAQLSGQFGFGRVLGHSVWNLNDPALASATAQYLVKGGTCPLDCSNRTESKLEEHMRLNAMQHMQIQDL